jgi:hypothetical protein
MTSVFAVVVLGGRGDGVVASGERSAGEVVWGERSDGGIIVMRSSRKRRGAVHGKSESREWARAGRGAGSGR